MCAVVGSLIVSWSSYMFAAKAKQTYTVTVEYLSCNGQGTQAETRTEQWKDKRGNTVYQEFTDCDGKTTTSGKKPLISGDGGDIWEMAEDISSDRNISMAAAISELHKPITDSTEKDSIGIVIGEYYEFEFPIEWLVNRVAEINVIQSSIDIDISSDVDVEVVFIRLSDGLIIVPSFVLLGGTNFVFDTRVLDIECNYSIVVSQDFPELEETLIIENYNFCVMP